MDTRVTLSVGFSSHKATTTTLLSVRWSFVWRRRAASAFVFKICIRVLVQVSIRFDSIRVESIRSIVPFLWFDGLLACLIVMTGYLLCPSQSLRIHRQSVYICATRSDNPPRELAYRDRSPHGTGWKKDLRVNHRNNVLQHI